MHRIEILGISFKYLVGPFTVGIINKSNGKKYIASIEEVVGDGKHANTRELTGSSDNRVSATEVAAYILSHKEIYRSDVSRESALRIKEFDEGRWQAKVADPMANPRPEER